MKKLLIAFLLLVSFKSHSQLIIAPAGNGAPAGNYPAIFDEHLKGSYRCVRDTFERNSIPLSFRKNMMLVGDTTLKKIWKYDSLRNSWSEFGGASISETDPIYSASSWFGTTNNSSNWNTAFGWGNHAGLYPSISGSYTNPSWLVSLPYSKITGTPTIPDISGKLNASDTANKWVGSIYKKADSIIFTIGSTRYAIKDSVGGGGSSFDPSVNQTITAPLWWFQKEFKVGSHASQVAGLSLYDGNVDVGDFNNTGNSTLLRLTDGDGGLTLFGNYIEGYDVNGETLGFQLNTDGSSIWKGSSSWKDGSDNVNAEINSLGNITTTGVISMNYNYSGIATPNNYTTIVGSPYNSGNGTQVEVQDNAETVKILCYDWYGTTYPMAVFNGNNSGTLAGNNIGWTGGGALSTTDGDEYGYAEVVNKNYLSNGGWYAANGNVHGADAADNALTANTASYIGAFSEDGTNLNSATDVRGILTPYWGINGGGAANLNDITGEYVDGETGYYRSIYHHGEGVKGSFNNNDGNYWAWEFSVDNGLQYSYTEGDSDPVTWGISSNGVANLLGATLFDNREIDGNLWTTSLSAQGISGTWDPMFTMWSIDNLYGNVRLGNGGITSDAGQLNADFFHLNSDYCWVGDENANFFGVVITPEPTIGVTGGWSIGYGGNASFANGEVNLQDDGQTYFGSGSGGAPFFQITNQYLYGWPNVSTESPSFRIDASSGAAIFNGDAIELGYGGTGAAYFASGLFQIGSDGSMSTDANTNNWKLGGVNLASVGFDDSKYLTVNINGTDYNLALCNIAR